MSHLKNHNEPVILGKGLLHVFENSFSSVFKDDKPCDTDQDVAEAKGRWLYLAREALQGIIEFRQGSRGGGLDGAQSQLRITGIDDKKIATLINKLKSFIGDTPNAKRKRSERVGGKGGNDAKREKSSID